MSGMLEKRERESKEAEERLREALLLGEGLEEEGKGLRKRLQEAQGRIKGVQGEIEEAQDRAEGLERALQACKKSEGSAKEEVLSLKDEIIKLEGECRSMRAEVSVTKASIVERSKQVLGAKSLAERLGGELELERTSVQALEKRLSDVGSQRSEFHARACKAEKELDDARAAAERLNEEVMRLKEEVVRKGQAADKFEGEGRVLRGELDALRVEMADERDAHRSEMASARSLLQISQAQAADSSERFEALVAMQAERGMAVAARMVERMRNFTVGRAFSGWRDKAGAKVRPKTLKYDGMRLVS
jgi:chromosome segregation ATPase